MVKKLNVNTKQKITVSYYLSDKIFPVLFLELEIHVSFSFGHLHIVT